MDGRILVFVHIPKTAGTTLRAIIERQYPWNGIFYACGDRIHKSRHEFVAWLKGMKQRVAQKGRVQRIRRELKNLSEEEKLRVRCLVGHMSFGLYKYLSRPADHIMMLRRPVARIISLYYAVLRNSRHRHHEEVTSKNMSLNDYVSSGLFWERSNQQTGMISGMPVMDPVATRGPLPAEALDVAKRNLREHFVVAGLTERFDESLLLYKRLLGWRNVYYVRQNVTRDRPRLREIPASTIRLIEKHNELDMDLYEFAKKRFEALVEEQGPSFARELRSFRRWNKVYGAGVKGYRRLHQGVRSIEAVSSKMRETVKRRPAGWTPGGRRWKRRPRT